MPLNYNLFSASEVNAKLPSLLQKYTFSSSRQKNSDHYGTQNYERQPNELSEKFNQFLKETLKAERMKARMLQTNPDSMDSYLLEAKNDRSQSNLINLTMTAE